LAVCPPLSDKFKKIDKSLTVIRSP